MNTLCEDIINEITCYLSIQDIYHLSLTCSQYKHLFKNKIINNVKNKCKILFARDDQTFFKLLRITNSVLTGGFILEAILNESYHSVITIYCSETEHLTLTHFFNKLFGWYSTETSTMDMIHCIKTYYTKYNYLSQDCLKLISIKNNDLLNFIKNNNDMNICKNIYYNDNLYINNINNMFNKQIIVDNNPFYHMTDYYYYQNYNFKLNLTNLYIDLTKFKINLYTNKTFTNYKISNHVYPILKCSYLYNPCDEYHNCILEQCHHQCIIQFLDSSVKHYHYKVYNRCELEIIIMV